MHICAATKSCLVTAEAARYPAVTRPTSLCVTGWFVCFHTASEQRPQPEDGSAYE